MYYIKLKELSNMRITKSYKQYFFLSPTLFIQKKSLELFYIVYRCILLFLFLFFNLRGGKLQ